MFKIEVEGMDRLTLLESRMEQLLSPAHLTERTILIAQQAGIILLQASVRACIEAVYDSPNFPSLWTTTPSHPTGYVEGGNEATRTNSLLDSHIVTDDGLIQTVQVDPDASAELSGSPRANRELVLDYAVPVHEGYEQYVYGHDTGVFHPGKFWFDVALQEAGPVIASFIEIAFNELIEEILTEVFL